MAVTTQITGGPLDEWVQKQIDLRQKVIGNHPKVADLDKRILLNHNKGAWVRLASSVNILDNKDGKDRLGDANGVNEYGNNLAKEYTLFGGVNFNPLSTKGGIFTPDPSKTNNFPQSYSYGIGDTTQGYQPIPGIDSVNIRHTNRGAIRNFDIKLRANNQTQFSIIETLYLRLGYYVLLEWGHTNYVNNDKEYVTNPEVGIVYDEFMEGSKTDNQITSLINKERRSSGGNYDGALIKITNFNWNLESDGSYSITLNGIGKGGLIDSLTLNYPGENNPYEPYYWIDPEDDVKTKLLNFYEEKQAEDESLSEAYLRVVSQKAAEGDYDNLKTLGAIESTLDENEQLTLRFANEDPTVENPDDDNAITITDQNKSCLNTQLFELHKRLKQQSWDENGRFKKLAGSSGEVVSVKFDNPHSDSGRGAYEYNYITLHLLLNLVKGCLLDSKNNTDINIDCELGDNYMFTHWYQHSIDPRVCLVPFTYYDTEDEAQKILFEELSVSNEQGILATELNDFSRNFRVSDTDIKAGDRRFIGKIMHIYVNMEHVAKILSTVINNDTGTISCYNFLNKLTGDINRVLGGINNLNITFNPDKKGGGGSIQLRDDTVIPGLTDMDREDDVALRLYGTKPGQEGSFVTNVSSNTKIDSNTINSISIGAVAGGVNSSTPALSRLNAGTSDRLEEISQNVKGTNNNSKTEKDLLETYASQNKFIENTYIAFKHPSDKSIQTAQSNLKDLLEYDLAVKTLNGYIAGKGFLPINLSIEMQGLAGILLYQRIKPSGGILPLAYANDLTNKRLIDFVVLALDHSIQNNVWTTTINALAYPTKADRGKSVGKGGFSLHPQPEEDIEFTDEELNLLNQL